MPTPAPVSSAIDARFVSLASSTLIYHHCFDFACHAMRVQPGTTARPGSPRIRCASDPCNIISPSLSQSLSPSPSPSLRLFHSWICAVHGLGQSLSLSLSHSFDRSIALDSTSSERKGAVQSSPCYGMAWHAGAKTGCLICYKSARNTFILSGLEPWPPDLLGCGTSQAGRTADRQGQGSHAKEFIINAISSFCSGCRVRDDPRLRLAAAAAGSKEPI